MPVNPSLTTSPGTVQPAPDQSLGFDADSPISQGTAQAFAGQGYRFCVRYLSLQASTAPGDLTAAEAQGILEGGLALMPVQHVLEPGWTPTAQLGEEHGANAAAQALAIGVPPQVNVWLDLEGVNAGATPQDVIAYCTSWFQEVSVKDYLPGLYVGANCGLDGQQLYDLPFQHYWHSESTVPAIPGRGYQMMQKQQSGTVNGLSIDVDTTMVDQLGGVPQWWVRAG